MSLADTRPAPAEASTFYVQWGPVIAGAMTAAALAFVLHSFAAAVGLGVSSAAPTWRDGSVALWILSGLYLILVALASYGLGGYVAGRSRARFTAAASNDEVEMRDGGHGLLVWALATLLTALLLLGGASALTRLAAPSGGPSGPATSVAGENIIALDLDRLFRTERRQEGDMNYARAEAGRILLTSSSHRGVLAEDRAYLVRLVAARTGATDAERRVDAAIASANENIARARKSSVILAFMAGAAALLGAAAAWFAACVGGRHRDGTVSPSLMGWSATGPRRTVLP
jgi:hypothetical protein